MDELDLLGVGLIQGRVVDHQDATITRDMLFNLVPERRGIRLEPMQGRVKASCAARRACSGCTRAASVQLTTFGVATRKLM